MIPNEEVRKTLEELRVKFSRSDKEYRVTDNGLSLLENVLKYLEEQEEKPMDWQIKLMILKVKDKIEWFLGNEIMEVDSSERDK